MIGYCVKCRGKKEIKDGQKVRTKRDRSMLKGKCPDCGTTICRFLKKGE